MRGVRVTALILIAALCGAIQAFAATGTANVAVDGTTLATDYYLPAGSGPFPVIMARTSYGRASYASEAVKWVSYGYAFVAQDTRPFATEQSFETDGWGPKKDAEIAIAWIRAQSWCDGKVGTLGFSAPGALSMLASGAASLLTTQIIENAPSSLYGQMAFQGGVFRHEFINWDTLGRWRESPSYNDYWSHYDSVAIAPQITTAGLHMTSWFDIFQKGGIDGFTSRQHNGGAGAVGRQHLLIDPTDHGGHTGELTFPNASPSPGRTATRRAFNDYYIRGSGGNVGYTVKYYIMGASGETGAPGNEWRTANDWPPYPVTSRAYYLGASGVLSTAPPATNSYSLTFTFDPLNPVPTLGGQNLTLSAGPRDQRSISGRADVLKFATNAISAPVEICGGVTVKLYVTSTAVDTDFTAKLVDIYPDGREILFLDGIQRVKYRNSFTTPSPLPPGTVGEVTIDLWHTSLIFNTGHRIGVQISSSNYPRFEVNPNNGNDLPQYSGSTIVPSSVASAQNTVHFSGIYPSALYLPVASSLDADEDWLDEQAEAANHTDPNNRDTDGDTLADGAEVYSYHTDPANADTDGNGANDGAQRATYRKRILILGDSWAASMATIHHDVSPPGAPGFGSFDAVLAANGFPTYVTEGATAWGGRRADQFATIQSYRDLIANTLNSNPDIVAVHLVIGGNDFLSTASSQNLFAGSWDASTRDARWATVQANVQTIVNQCLSIRPNLNVLISDYDYLGKDQAMSAYGWAFGGMTQRQINDAFVELGLKKSAIAASTPRCYYVTNWGVLQAEYDDPAAVLPLPGAYPAYTPYTGGDLDYGMPITANVGDGIHPTDQSHRMMLQRCMDQFYKEWLNDVDEDGMSYADETRDLDPNVAGIQNPFDPDVSDSTGNALSNVPDGIADGLNDYDGDELSNSQELLLGINLMLSDTDGDGLSDGAEVNIHHTNPLLVDTDGDGYSDGLEVSLGQNPNDPSTALDTASSVAVGVLLFLIMLFGFRRIIQAHAR